MKIENTPTPVIQNKETNAQEKLAQIRAAQAKRAENEATIKENAKKDSVAFSEQAKVFARAYEKLQNSPDVREEKVTAIKQQIENGQYQINYSAVAAKIGKVMGIE